MGLLTTVLGCEVSLEAKGFARLASGHGKVEGGCLVVSQNVALQLIEQIEAKANEKGCQESQNR